MVYEQTSLQVWSPFTPKVGKNRVVIFLFLDKKKAEIFTSASKNQLRDKTEGRIMLMI